MRKLVVLLLVVMGCTDPIPGIQQGVWGGAGAQMTVSDTGAVLQFNCASGAIKQPLTVNGQGEGQWSGTYLRASGAPNTPPDTPHAATYTATVHNGHMSLLPSVPDLLIEFVAVDLVQGQPGQLAICP